MKIEYVHASKYGNGAAVAAKFQEEMAAKDVAVDVHHIRDVRPTELGPADLYVFSSPGRMGKPIRGMRRFLKRVKLPRGDHVRDPDHRGGREAGQENRADADGGRAGQVAARQADHERDP